MSQKLVNPIARSQLAVVVDILTHCFSSSCVPQSSNTKEGSGDGAELGIWLGKLLGKALYDGALLGSLLGVWLGKMLGAELGSCEIDGAFVVILVGASVSKK